MGFSIKWDITYKCNLNCGHCINGHLLDNNGEELSTEDVKEIIDKLSKLEYVEYIHLLGGEPTFRKDFVEIADYFYQKNIRFGFNTNGLTLDSEKIEQVLNNKSLKSIIISLEGPNAALNDKLRGKNVFNVVIPKLRNLIKQKKDRGLDHFSVIVNTVVSKENYLNIMDMIDFCIELGVNELNLLEMIADGNAKGKQLLLTEAEEMYLVKELAKKYSSVKDKIVIKPKFARPIVKDYCKVCLDMDFPDIAHGCGAGSTFAFLNNKGILAPCDRYLKVIKEDKNAYTLDLKNNDFMDIWKQDIFSQPYELSVGSDFYAKYTPCNECEHLRKSCYPCVIYGLDKENLEVQPCVKYFKYIAEKESLVNA